MGTSLRHKIGDNVRVDMLGELYPGIVLDIDLEIGQYIIACYDYFTEVKIIREIKAFDIKYKYDKYATYEAAIQEYLNERLFEYQNKMKFSLL